MNYAVISLKPVNNLAYLHIYFWLDAVNEVCGNR